MMTANWPSQIIGEQDIPLRIIYDVLRPTIRDRPGRIDADMDRMDRMDRDQIVFEEAFAYEIRHEKFGARACSSSDGVGE